MIILLKQTRKVFSAKTGDGQETDEEPPLRNYCAHVCCRYYMLFEIFSTIFRGARRVMCLKTG